MQKRMLAVVALLLAVSFSAARASEPDIYVVYANGSSLAIDGKQGLAELEQQYEENPQTMTVYVYKHPLYFKVLSGSESNVTRMQFSCPDLGLNQTFKGANTSAIASEWKDYVQRTNLNSRLVNLVMFGRG